MGSWDAGEGKELREEVRPTTSSIPQNMSDRVQVLPDDQSFHCTHIQSLQGVGDTEAVLAGIEGDLVKVLLDESLLLDEFNVRERVGGELDGLMSAGNPNSFGWWVSKQNDTNDKQQQGWLEGCGLGKCHARFLRYGLTECEAPLTWLNPFSPPYETSTTLTTFANNRGSNRSLPLKSVFNSALPANTNPATLTLSAVMKCCTASSATFLT